MFKIHDGTNEFRVDLVGRLAGDCVNELRAAWIEALCQTVPRQFTVDLTRVSGYDAEGRKLLREMHQHGTQFAAGTPEALVYLREISTPVRRVPALVQEVTPPYRKENRHTPAIRPKAAGQ